MKHKPEATDNWKRYRKVATVLAMQMDIPFCVETLEGTMHGKPGDYLVMNEETEECWPVKKEIFEKTYEEVIEKRISQK